MFTLKSSHARPYQTAQFYRMRLLLLACGLVVGSLALHSEGAVLLALLGLGQVWLDFWQMRERETGRVPVPALVFSPHPADLKEYRDLLRLLFGYALGMPVLFLLTLHVLREQQYALFWLFLLTAMFNAFAWQLLNWGREVWQMLREYHRQRRATRLPVRTLSAQMQQFALRQVATPTPQPNYPDPLVQSVARNQRFP